MDIFLPKFPLYIIKFLFSSKKPSSFYTPSKNVMSMFFSFYSSWQKYSTWYQEKKLLFTTTLRNNAESFPLDIISRLISPRCNCSHNLIELLGVFFQGLKCKICPGKSRLIISHLVLFSRIWALKLRKIIQFDFTRESGITF